MKVLELNQKSWDLHEHKLKFNEIKLSLLKDKLKHIAEFNRFKKFALHRHDINLLKICEKSFEFWDNEIDKIWDNV